jgi:hypothetical protein
MADLTGTLNRSTENGCGLTCVNAAGYSVSNQEWLLLDSFGRFNDMFYRHPLKSRTRKKDEDRPDPTRINVR